MDTLASTFSSRRVQRYLFWAGALVLIAGVVVLVIKLAGGSDKTAYAPSKGFKPALPAKSVPLRTASGHTISSYGQLDPSIRQTITTFLATAVKRHDADKSWSLVTPSLRQGYTKATWAKNPGSVIPYPIARKVFNLVAATKNSVMVDIQVGAPLRLKLNAVTFRIELVPRHGRWLVDYWMPRWSAIMPDNN